MNRKTVGRMSLWIALGFLTASAVFSMVIAQAYPVASRFGQADAELLGLPIYRVSRPDSGGALRGEMVTANMMFFGVVAGLVWAGLGETGRTVIRRLRAAR